MCAKAPACVSSNTTTAADGGYDTVAYEGIVTNDGDEITGRWDIPGEWSGTFIMTRDDGIALVDQAAATDEASTPR